jgi:ATP-dependent Lhr-like helicase
LQTEKRGFTVVGKETPFIPFTFHPIVQRWFAAHFAKPTPAQERGWDAIASGRDVLIAAPTGSGKTLAAFLWSIDRLARRGLAGKLADDCRVVYVSPLKALSNDIEKNLREPLEGILSAADGPLPEIRVAVRTGDTPAKERQLMIRRPPHILITTPESLYLVLTARRSRDFLRRAETVIIDEIHAVAGDKRGAHLALSLERLDALVGRRLQRIGLSATQKPIEEIAHFLVGAARRLQNGSADCALIDAGQRKDLDLGVELPDAELGPIATQLHWGEIYDRLAERARGHRTTLVFVNTRRLVERVAHAMASRIGEDKVGAHHGSLSRKKRLEVEEGLKTGRLSLVVATASLELGIDIGHVDLVCHIGAPRTLGGLLQRVGRSGHWFGATPKGILYPLTRDDLAQSAAAICALRRGELDRLRLPRKPLDVLAQQIVAWTASMPDGVGEEELFRCVRKAYPYRDLSRGEFTELIEILAEGIATRRGRRGALLHRDRVQGRVRPRRGAALVAITNGGTIPEAGDYEVIELPGETFVGTVNEDFAIESLAGDIFLLGNRSWRIRGVARGRVWVEDAHGLPPTIPFWLGEAPARTAELSAAVSRLRREIASRFGDEEGIVEWLTAEAGLPARGATALVSYLRESEKALGCVPDDKRIVAERFFDEAGGMQLVIHAPFGGRINRAWGMALRKRFCVTFDNELQAAATDDGIVISLGEKHSFPLGDAFGLVSRSSLREVLIQAALAAPMFTNRWRWNATRALAVLRHDGRARVPIAIQRMRAEDLLSAVFPEQVMCQDNRTGPVNVPNHPLVRETLADCLNGAMDVDGLDEVLEKIENGEIATVAVDSRAPSLLAHEILNANPYAFLDDAPLEERRSRAVSLRRVDPDLSRGLGALSVEAVSQVAEQIWPRVRDTDELHDLLLSVYLLSTNEVDSWREYAGELARSGRATTARWLLDGVERSAMVATERIGVVHAALPEVRFDPEIASFHSSADKGITMDEALLRILRGWVEHVGPFSATEMSARIGLPSQKTQASLLALENAGVVLRGFFTAGAGSEAQWCERNVLARIHRLTLSRLRREIEPVSAADFMRFLLTWQRVAPQTQTRGREGLVEIIAQLQGLELPARAWERDVLPARISNYDPSDLEQLCLGGIIAWGRLKPGLGEGVGEEGETRELPSRGRLRLLTRSVPIGFVLREEKDYFVRFDDRAAGEAWGREMPEIALEVLHYLENNGASFLSEIGRGTGRLKTEVEQALWHLVARGFVSGDGVSGLRALLTPDRLKKRARRDSRFSSAGRREGGTLSATGRWSLWRVKAGRDESSGDAEKRTEFIARQLLHRYGVVFRKILTRESPGCSWRSLLACYRRLEERGELRGGRFVAGFTGLQFALPEAVDRLRAVRRSAATNTPIIVSAADPLNLLGIVSQGQRLSPYSRQVIVYRDGTPVDVGTLGSIRSRWQEALAKS